MKKQNESAKINTRKRGGSRAGSMNLSILVPIFSQRKRWDKKLAGRLVKAIKEESKHLLTNKGRDFLISQEKEELYKILAKRDDIQIPVAEVKLRVNELVKAGENNIRLKEYFDRGCPFAHDKELIPAKKN